MGVAIPSRGRLKVTFNLAECPGGDVAGVHRDGGEAPAAADRQVRPDLAGLDTASLPQDLAEVSCGHRERRLLHVDTDRLEALSRQARCF